MGVDGAYKCTGAPSSFLNIHHSPWAQKQKTGSKCIGMSWVCLERNTLHKKKVGPDGQHC